MVPLKRRRAAASGSDRPPRSGSTSKSAVRFPHVVIFLLERKMGASRRVFLSHLGRSKGFMVEETYSESVTHIVSEENSGDEVRAWVDSHPEGRKRERPACLLDISWYTESMREGLPVEILDRHILQEQQRNGVGDAVFSVPSYACQRNTPSQDHNSPLTDALSVLAESAEFNADEGRGVAFRRAAALLKSLDWRVTGAHQLRGLPCLGEHMLRVTKDILENGISSEVEATQQSKHYNSMKVLTGIFGVGVKTANRWFREGIHSLQLLRSSGYTLNRAQQAGLTYYDDLSQPVTKAEADAIGVIVKEAAISISPGAEITLTGGFRRGKATGHDVDFLITQPAECAEKGLIAKVVSRLESQGLLLYHTCSRNSYHESSKGPSRPSSSMDYFEKCFSIFKLSKDRVERQKEETSHPDTKTDLRPEAWRAVRVDLVVSPKSQFSYALLGWTGSKLFERELRRWAVQEKSMYLSSHALYDRKQARYLEASSEEEIFAHLGLEYIPPSARNA